MPRLCSLITRVVQPTSAEARCEGVAKAIKKELSNVDSKKVWDTGKVCSLNVILRNPKIPEAMFGNVFSILGIKNKELGDDLQHWKTRCVFQGSNVRTKTRTSAADVFEETSKRACIFCCAGRNWRCIAEGIQRISPRRRNCLLAGRHRHTNSHSDFR